MGGFIIAVFAALFGGVIMVVITKKPAMGILGMLAGAILGGILSNMTF